MPELPEVETIRAALDKTVTGREINRVEVLTNTLRTKLVEEDLHNALAGKKINSIRRRAKYLFFDFADKRVLQVHLGMTGSFRVEADKQVIQKHDRVIFYLDRHEKLVYNDIRKFGEIILAEIPLESEFPAKFAKFAPEPLSEDFSAAYLYSVLQKTKIAVKPAIMQQRRVVGVGNIYANEALFAAEIAPQRSADTLSRREVTRLLKEIKKVLRRSLELGGTTISDFKSLDGSEGKFALELKVYGRDGERCLRRGCKGRIAKIIQTGRSTFYCKDCQR